MELCPQRTCLDGLTASIIYGPTCKHWLFSYVLKLKEVWKGSLPRIWVLIVYRVSFIRLASIYRLLSTRHYARPQRYKNSLYFCETFTLVGNTDVTQIVIKISIYQLNVVTAKNERHRNSMGKSAVLGMSIKLYLHLKSWPQLAGTKIVNVADA